MAWTQTDGNRTSALPAWLTPVAGGAILVGAIGTGAGLASQVREETWWILLLNFLYWTGLAQGMLVCSAAFRTAQASWEAGPNRIGRSTLGFLAFSVPAFLVLWTGRTHWLTWVGQSLPEKAWWLNEPFFLGRNLLALVLIALVSAAFVGAYRKAESLPESAKPAHHHRLNVLAIMLAVAYALTYTLFGFDLMMSLDPHWYSTLYGAYFFVSTLYLAMAAMILIAALVREPLGLEAHLGPRQFQDMANILLGFGIFTTGLFFAQFLTIWYGNLPEETSHLIPRLYQYPWRGVAWAVLFGAYLGPFALLQVPSQKANPKYVRWPALLVVCAMGLERWIMIVPSFTTERLAGLHPFALSSGLIFLGVFVLVVVRSLSKRPQVSQMDLELTLSD